MIANQDLKRRKLDQKGMEAQHQREQHEYRMLQMRMVMAQRGVSVTQTPQSLEGFGLLDELNSTALPPVGPYSDSTAYSI